MARLAGADESFFLVNGSTAGLLTAICACTERKGKILTARNCHKAVYHGIFLQELEARYLYPASTEAGIQGSVLPEDVTRQLELYPEARAVLLTSPTYDGVVSDIRRIGEAVHAKGKILIVDEAHGAHFGFSKAFPQKALALGADIVIESLHKTLPSFTQTAVLHIKGNRVDRKKIRKYLGIFQTSSPSYLFMAGMDRCSRLLEQEGEALFDRFEKMLNRFYESARALRCIQILNGAEVCSERGIYDKDPSKILISAEKAGISGQALGSILREQYHLELEMTSGHYATALTSICDSEEGFERLALALKELDKRFTDKQFIIEETGKNLPFSGISDQELYRPVRQQMKLWEADGAPERTVALEESPGLVSKEFIYMYPPGIPFIVPGEVIPEELPGQIRLLKDKGYEIQGPEDYSLRTIKVVL